MVTLRGSKGLSCSPIGGGDREPTKHCRVLVTTLILGHKFIIRTCHYRTCQLGHRLTVNRWWSW